MLRITLSLLSIVSLIVSFAQVTELSEDFNAGFPTGWTLYNDTNNVHSNVAEYDTAWIVIENPDSAGDSVISSTSYFDPANTADRWLISPKVTLGALGNYLSWKEKSVDPSFPDAYTVMLSFTDSLKESFTDTIANVTGANPTWLERKFDLAEMGYVNQDVFVAFKLNSNDQFILMLDSISVVRDDPASIEENKLETFKVYPNPTEDFVVAPNTIESMTIFDINGRLMFNIAKNKANVSSLKSGVYIIEATNNKGIVSRSRFTKK